MNFKKTAYYSIAYTAIIACITYATTDFKQLDLIGNPKYYVGHYTDQDEGGNSEISFASDNPIQFSYTIKNQKEYPFAGIYVEDTLGGVKINLQRYDQVEVHISSTKSTLIPITLNALWNLKNRPYQKLVKTNKEKSVHVFNISEFQTPPWWMKYNNVLDDSNQDFSEVLTLNVEDGIHLESGTQDQIIISKIAFSKNNNPTLLTMGVIEAIGLIILFLIPFFKPEKEFIPIAASKINLDNSENPKDMIISVIGENYAQPDLTVRKVAKMIGLKESEVSKNLKLSFKKSFKEYLNFVRLEEAKRLLKNTSLNVSEIAYTVGYNNVTHFNRVFKSSEGISPNEFRA